MTKTTLILNENYKNMKIVNDSILIAPDGYTITHKMNISNPMKELFAHSGILIKLDNINREVDGRYTEINGITLELSAPNELTYVSKNKKEAATIYQRILKPAIEAQGYIIAKNKPCVEELPCDRPKSIGTKLGV